MTASKTIGIGNSRGFVARIAAQGTARVVLHSSQEGPTLTLTATVSPPSQYASMPTGQVVFLNGDSAFAVVSLDATGTATYNTSTAPPGTYTISTAATPPTRRPVRRLLPRSTHCRSGFEFRRYSLHGTAFRSIAYLFLYALALAVPRPASFINAPLAFEPNLGQADPAVQFASHGDEPCAQL